MLLPLDSLVIAPVGQFLSAAVVHLVDALDTIVPKLETPNTYPCQGFPPALGEAQQADLKAAVQELPTKSGIELANWNWKVVRNSSLSASVSA